MPKRTQPKRGRGRPTTGKRSNPEYRQTSLWLRCNTLAETISALVLSDGTRYELSELVERLLQAWLKRGAKLPDER
jgi:hypothetical protein